MRVAACFGAERGGKVICEGVPFEKEIPGTRVQEHEPCEVQRQGRGAEDALVEGEAEAVGSHDVHAAGTDIGGRAGHPGQYPLYAGPDFCPDPALALSIMPM